MWTCTGCSTRAPIRASSSRRRDRRYDADQTIVLHELLHQRGLTDLYAYCLVHHFGDPTRTQVNITENGKLVAGSYLMPPLLGTPGDPLLYRRPVAGSWPARTWDMHT